MFLYKNTITFTSLEKMNFYIVKQLALYVLK